MRHAPRTRGRSAPLRIFTGMEETSSARDIVARMAASRKMERLAARITGHAPAEPVVKDLVQTMFVYLLTFPEDKLLDLYRCGQLDFFVVRCLINQWYGSRSSFRVAFRKFSAITEDINEVIREEDAEL